MILMQPSGPMPSGPLTSSPSRTVTRHMAHHGHVYRATYIGSGHRSGHFFPVLLDLAAAGWTWPFVNQIWLGEGQI